MTGTGRAGVRYQRCPACDQLAVVFPLGERQVVGGVEVVVVVVVRSAASATKPASCSESAGAPSTIGTQKDYF